MKKYVLVIASIMSFFCITTKAQNTEYKNALRISPVQFANSTFEVNYERYFNDKKHGVVISPALLLKQNDPESLTGFKGNVQYRFYFAHLHKDNNKTWIFSNLAFYGGTYVQYLTATEEYWASYGDIDLGYVERIFEKDINSIEGGVLLGMQIDIIPRLTLDFNFGGGIKFADVEDSITPFLNGDRNFSYGVLDREYTGVVPQGALQLGFNF